MRDLNQETWFLYTVTSIEHFERCAQACQDFVELFDQLMTKHEVHGRGNLDYWVKTYYGHAKDIRRLIELVKLGDYLPMSDELNDADTSYKGIIEQILSWMTTEEEEKWDAAFARLSSLCGISHEAMRNNEWKGLNWANQEENKDEENFQEMLDRDDGHVGDYEWYVIESQDEGLLPKPDPYPQYFVDKSRSCRAGETCPWTGVWVPEQALSEGLEHFNLAFAVAGRPMQPAYRIVAWVKDETFSDPEYLASVGEESDDDPIFYPETKAEDALWYPVVQVEAESQPAASSSRLRGLPSEIVPQTGWWHTPALKGAQGLRYFEQGQRFPETRTTDYGGVIWGYDPDQQKDPPQK